MIAIARIGNIVSPHFGQSEAYDIYSVENGSIEFKISVSTEGEHICHADPDFKGYPVHTMIAGGMGQGAVNRLEALGFKIIRGVNGTVEAAAKAFAEGRLESSGEICNHHHH